MGCRSMRLSLAHTLLLSVVTTVLVVVEAPASQASGGLTLDRPRYAADSVVLRGKAPEGAQVRIIRRTADGWVPVASDRADSRGRYHVRVDRPQQWDWVVRASAGQHRSGPRRLDPAIAPVAPAPVDACGAQPEKADGTTWKCTFVDGFDGIDVDPTKWWVQETAISGVTNGPDGCIRKEPWTIGVGGGHLRLTAARTTPTFTCKSPFGPFVTDKATAALTTKGRFNQAFGRFAFRAKMPTTREPGAHSAIWLYPDQHTYGRWPKSGEIDVAEWYSARPEHAYPSVHYADGNTDVHSGWDGVFADASQFHNYVLEWTPTEMKFFYDGVLVFEHAWRPLAPLTGSQPFDKPFNIVLNQTWGHLWNAPTAATPKRVTMTVDWVRVWK
jgi:hypothetical protein